MIVYNITMKVNASIESPWVQWQKEEHIPAIMATKQFNDFKFYKLITEEKTDDPTYVVQYFADSLDNYSTYIDKFSTALRKKALDKWGNQFIGFRTLMQSVD